MTCITEDQCNKMDMSVYIHESTDGGLQKMCVDECPDDSPRNDDGECTACGGDSYWDPKIESCVEKCPYGYVLSRAGTTCLSACGENQKLVDG